MTKRELEVESYLYGKLPGKQIAYILEISYRTYRAHCAKIYYNSGVDNRVELMSLKIDDLNNTIEMMHELEAGADW